MTPDHGIFRDRIRRGRIGRAMNGKTKRMIRPSAGNRRDLGNKGVRTW